MLIGQGTGRQHRKLAGTHSLREENWSRQWKVVAQSRWRHGAKLRALKTQNVEEHPKAGGKISGVSLSGSQLIVAVIGMSTLVRKKGKGSDLEPYRKWKIIWVRSNYPVTESGFTKWRDPWVLS